jgi:hypothetical protein
MQKINVIKKRTRLTIIAGLIIAGFLVPTMSVCAALITVEAMVMPDDDEQQHLDEQLRDTLRNGGSPECVQTLLDWGADPNGQELRGSTRLQQAVSAVVIYERSPIIIQKLIAAGACLNAQDDRDHSSALMRAVPYYTRCGKACVDRGLRDMEELIKAGADINIKDAQSGETPLLYAIRFSPANAVSRVIKLLIAAGADETIKDKEGRTAEQVVARQKEAHDHAEPYDALTQALAERKAIARKCAEDYYVTTLRDYLIDRPLPIRSLVSMAEQYILEPQTIPAEFDPVALAKQRVIKATERQKMRAEITREKAIASRCERASALLAERMRVAKRRIEELQLQVK